MQPLKISPDTSFTSFFQSLEKKSLLRGLQNICFVLPKQRIGLQFKNHFIKSNCLLLCQCQYVCRIFCIFSLTLKRILSFCHNNGNNMTKISSQKCYPILCLTPIVIQPITKLYKGEKKLQRLRKFCPLEKIFNLYLYKNK